MDITLNLASPAIRRRRRLHQLAVAGLCVNLFLGIGNVLLYRSFQADRRTSEERVRQAQQIVRKRERSAGPAIARLSPKDVEHLGARVDLYNQIIEGANFSWTRLLFELERAIPKDVTLVAIQPDFSKGGVTLSGDAKTMEDLLRCVRGLKDRDAFHQVYLLQHGLKAGKPTLRFTISLQYREEAA
ncbi:MAG: PilN domain-containing protein [Candidatus Methylomirabilales bacterium]